MSVPARLPVCDEAALTPALVTPALKITTGLRDAAVSAALMKASPESTLSRYPTMTLVCGSSAKALRKLVSDRSALLPMLMSLARPRCRAAAQSRIAVHSAPDWEITEIPPGCGICLANEAFIRWWALIRPRQLGPSMATRRALQ